MKDKQLENVEKKYIYTVLVHLAAVTNYLSWVVYKQQKFIVHISGGWEVHSQSVW